MSDQETKSATEQSRSRPECVECGWGVVEDLALLMPERGVGLIMCANPWACWERQITLQERYGLTGAS